MMDYLNKQYIINLLLKMIIKLVRNKNKSYDEYVMCSRNCIVIGCTQADKDGQVLICTNNFSNPLKSTQNLSKY